MKNKLLLKLIRKTFLNLKTLNKLIKKKKFMKQYLIANNKIQDKIITIKFKI